MITLTKRLKQETETGGGKAKKEEGVSRVSIRDKLLVKEVQEMEENKPQHCKVKFDDPSSLHDFFIIISPEEGFWQGGRFKFHVKVGNWVCLTQHLNSNFQHDMLTAHHASSSQNKAVWGNFKT